MKRDSLVHENLQSLGMESISTRPNEFHRTHRGKKPATNFRFIFTVQLTLDGCLLGVFRAEKISPEEINLQQHHLTTVSASSPAVANCKTLLRVQEIELFYSTPTPPVLLCSPPLSDCTFCPPPTRSKWSDVVMFGSSWVVVPSPTVRCWSVVVSHVLLFSIPSNGWPPGSVFVTSVTSTTEGEIAWLE